MQPELTLKQTNTRIGITCVIALVALVIALIALFVSLSLVFYAGWVLDGTKIGCPVVEPVLYLKQMRIKEVVFTVYLGLWGMCLLGIAGLGFKNKIDITYEHRLPTKYRIIYPLLISLALISAIVCLFTIIKIYVSIGYIRDYKDNGLIPTTCLTTAQLNGFINKMNPIVIVIVLLAIMALLTALIFVSLPFRYFVLEGPRQDQVYLPLSKTQRIQQKQVKKVSKFQISQHELLEHPVKPQKIFQSIAIGNDEPFIVFLPTQVMQKISQPVKYFTTIGVGGDLRPKSKDAAVNSVQTEMKNTGVGNHFSCRDQVTDCEGLVQEKQFIVEPTTSRIEKIQELSNKVNQSPVRDGYYYLTTHPEAVSQDEEHRSVRKLESMKSSGRKLLEKPLRASKGTKQADLFHQNILEANKKINDIYTPTNHKNQGSLMWRAGIRSSEKKMKSSFS